MTSQLKVTTWDIAELVEAPLVVLVMMVIFNLIRSVRVVSLDSRRKLDVKLEKS